MTLNPETLAREELAKVMIPTPDDIMAELSPLAALFYLDQLAWGVFKLWTFHLSSASVADVEAADDAAETLQGIGVALGNLDAVCARIGLAPTEAAATAEIKS